MFPVDAELSGIDCVSQVLDELGEPLLLLRLEQNPGT